MWVIKRGDKPGVPLMESKAHDADLAALRDENAQLRAAVARLESRVDELDTQVHTDVLLPVANRRGLIRTLERVIARHDRHGTPAALLFTDVDGLKTLNDSFGHAAGDAALAHLAGLLLGSTRQNDLVARIGGDEFAILLDHASDSEACDTAERLVNTVAESEFLFEGHALPLSVAIGYAPIQTGDTPLSVLDRADEAMYRDKAAA